MDPLLEIKKLSITFPGPSKPLEAVRGLDLAIPPASITCLVGESGCGKSLTCRAILRLTPEYATISGEIFFQDQDLVLLPDRSLEAIRGAKIGMIFQEPMTSLNPVLTVGKQTAEPLRLHLGMSRHEAHERVIELFTSVGIPSPEIRYNDYPHQLSGGMRQRVMIAMALACGPSLLLADEPTTALDSTIQGQILRLLQSESGQRNMAVLLITHDLNVVAETSASAGVMYGGILVESAPTRELFSSPMHPYTQGLIAAQPGRASIYKKKLQAIPGSVPTLSNMPKGCPFQPRCNRALPICASKLAPVSHFSPSHRVACWLYASSSAAPSQEGVHAI